MYSKLLSLLRTMHLLYPLPLTSNYLLYNFSKNYYGTLLLILVFFLHFWQWECTTLLSLLINPKKSSVSLQISPHHLILCEAQPASTLIRSLMGNIFGDTLYLWATPCSTSNTSDFSISSNIAVLHRGFVQSHLKHCVLCLDQRPTCSPTKYSTSVWEACGFPLW